MSAEAPVTVASEENEGKCNFLSSILSKVSPKLLQASIMLLVSVTHTDRMLLTKFKENMFTFYFRALNMHEFIAPGNLGHIM